MTNIEITYIKFPTPTTIGEKDFMEPLDLLTTANDYEKLPKEFLQSIIKVIEVMLAGKPVGIE